MSGDDFIETYADALPRDACAKLIQRFDADGSASRGVTAGGLDVTHKNSWDISLTGKPRWARGVLAFGSRAIGLYAAGGVAVGAFAFGGFAFGLIGIGAMVAAGAAVGGLAVGWEARGAMAIGDHGRGLVHEWLLQSGSKVVVRDPASGWLGGLGDTVPLLLPAAAVMATVVSAAFLRQWPAPEAQPYLKRLTMVWMPLCLLVPPLLALSAWNLPLPALLAWILAVAWGGRFVARRRLGPSVPRRPIRN